MISLACAERRGLVPRPRLTEATRLNEVKAPPHDGTPRARRPRVPLAVVPHENEVELGVQGLEFQEVLGLLLGEGLHVAPQHHLAAGLQISGQ